MSTAAAGLAALFAVGRTPLDHVLFTAFTIIGVVAFLILLSTAVRRPPWSPALTVDGAARELAARRASQVRRIDQMPVRWVVTEAARRAMPSVLGDGDGAAAPLRRFAGEFGDFGSAFARMPVHRMVVLGEPGAGKTTLVSKLFDDLLKGNNQPARLRL